jgi:DNA-binding transcriptional LysR family regulator
MPTAIPDWHLFRAFLAVVREGSLSSAARVLGTTQPTMGRQVAALEAALGVKLFTRSLDGLSPTEVGLRLIPSAEAMAAAVEAAKRSASGEVDELQGTVRVTASDVIGGEVLPSILAGIRAVYPRISVELALSNRNEDLLRGDADIAVRMVRPTQGALVAKRIAALRAGFGIGACQLGIARRDKNLVPVLHSEFIHPMEVWLAMHRDLRSSRRIRQQFDQLATRLSAYAKGSCFQK